MNKRRYAIVGGVLGGVLAGYFLLMGLQAFFDTYQLHFQSPVVFRSPMWITKTESKIISPVVETKEAGESAKTKVEPSPSPTPEPEKEQSMFNGLVKTAQAKEIDSIKGEASWYHTNGCMGCDANLIMANGEKLNDDAYTVALPPHIVNDYKLLNDNVKITNTENGKIVIAKVTDTGGFYELTKGKRIADLSKATKEALGCGGLCQVEVSF